MSVEPGIIFYFIWVRLTIALRPHLKISNYSELVTIFWRPCLGSLLDLGNLMIFLSIFVLKHFKIVRQRRGIL